MWTSPVESAGFAEHRDGEFLDAISCAHLKPALGRFWPRRGPCWDALAMAPSGAIVLVEAKSYPAEMQGSCQAGPELRARIENSLREAATHYQIPFQHDLWLSEYYQFANRLAFLYFLRVVGGMQAWLMNVAFANDPTSGSPTTVADWRAALKLVRNGFHLATPPQGLVEVVLPGVDRSALVGPRG